MFGYTNQLDLSFLSSSRSLPPPLNQRLGLVSPLQFWILCTASAQHTTLNITPTNQAPRPTLEYAVDGQGAVHMRFCWNSVRVRMQSIPSGLQNDRKSHLLAGQQSRNPWWGTILAGRLVHHNVQSKIPKVHKNKVSVNISNYHLLAHTASQSLEHQHDCGPEADQPWPE